jgi:hypothetical protein
MSIVGTDKEENMSAMRKPKRDSPTPHTPRSGNRTVNRSVPAFRQPPATTDQRYTTGTASGAASGANAHAGSHAGSIETAPLPVVESDSDVELAQSANSTVILGDDGIEWPFTLEWLWHNVLSAFLVLTLGSIFFATLATILRSVGQAKNHAELVALVIVAPLCVFAHIVLYKRGWYNLKLRQSQT